MMAVAILPMLGCRKHRGEGKRWMSGHGDSQKLRGFLPLIPTTLVSFLEAEHSSASLVKRCNLCSKQKDRLSPVRTVGPMSGMICRGFLTDCATIHESGREQVW